MTSASAVATSVATIPVLSPPTPDSEETAGRRTVSRAMWIGLWVWPSYTLLDVFMCFVAYPNAPFRVFVLYRILVELAFVGVYRASLRGTMELKRLFWLQNATFVAAAVGIAVMAVHLGCIRTRYYGPPCGGRRWRGGSIVIASACTAPGLTSVCRTRPPRSPV